MAMTVHDILMNADLFRRAYPCWPHPAPEEAPASLAAWLEQEGIATAAEAPEVAERLTTAMGDGKLAALLLSDPQLLRDAAIGITDGYRMGDQAWARENYWHGHDDPREGQ